MLADRCLKTVECFYFRKESICLINMILICKRGVIVVKLLYALSFILADIMWIVWKLLIA